jgi:hypothetical protein
MKNIKFSAQAVAQKNVVAFFGKLVCFFGIIIGDRNKSGLGIHRHPALGVHQADAAASNQSNFKHFLSFKNDILLYFPTF